MIGDKQEANMELALSYMIKKIDEYAVSVLGISARQLMEESGKAVAGAVRELTPLGGEVAVFAGKGNNGGDGYAAACLLLNEYKVTVYDVFGKGQRSEEGKYFLGEFIRLGGEVKKLPTADELSASLATVSCIVDAIFGVGYSGELSESEKNLISIIKRSTARKVAVDLPLGVNPDDGSINDSVLSVDVTVALSYIKPGLVSYPAKAYCGRVVLSEFGLPREKLASRFGFNSTLTDNDWARRTLPTRPDNTNKGSYGKALVITGSEKYKGAAYLSLEAALRSGAGRVTYLGCDSLRGELLSRFPEAIYVKHREDTEAAVRLSRESSATLIGSGSDTSEKTAELACALLSSEGSPLILDADAINSIALYGGAELIKDSPRTVILTPHPLEFSRLSGLSVGEIQDNRISVAMKYARENSCILLLKGAATVITDGEHLYINGSGSSALAKAGSGDVLAGLLVSLLSYSKSPIEATALAAYIHGRAGDNLAGVYSSYGVTPSDLPREICRILLELERPKI